MGILHKFLSKIFIAVFAVFICTSAFSASSNLSSYGDVGMADIGDFGLWTTENNREIFLNTLSYDLDQFRGEANKQLVDNYVPVAAKIGLAFINAFSHISHILDSSLVRFVIIFIIIAYGFWILFEAYTIISGQNKVQDKIQDIIKKGFMVGVWVAVLSYGPAKTFMLIVSPIMYMGTLFSDLILDATVGVLGKGVNLPDTCGAIHLYVKQHISDVAIIDAASAANIMCVPTRISGFCFTAIKMGWNWLSIGLGTSGFVFLAGLVFVGGFLYLAWQFAFMAFGVIADLFLGIIMLPFTAVSETVAKTTYKGIAGDIFNSFLKLFSTESLSVQISRFINAALHFIVLSVIIAFCIAMLSTVFVTDIETMVPSIDNQSFWIVALVSALTWWFAHKATSLANDIGGKITTTFGDDLQKDVNSLWSSAKKNTKDIIDIIKKSK